MEDIFSWVIPGSMLDLGARLLVLSFVIQLLIPQYSKIAIWFALVGGFGVGGGAGGWFGRWLARSTTAITGWTENWTAQAFGSGFGILVFAVIAVFIWRYAGKGGSGLQAKGKSKAAKVKQVVWLLAFAMAGTAVAGFPEVYGAADTAVAAVQDGITSALPS